MPKLKEDVVIADVRGMFDGPPFRALEGHCADASGMDFYQTSVGRKTGGYSTITDTGGTGVTTSIESIFELNPSDSPATSELWIVDKASPPNVKKLDGATTYVDVALDDTISIATLADNVDAVAFNGKFFIAYDTNDTDGDNRLHVYDPADDKVRRTGLRKPDAPTVANTGSGSYAATARYYKVAYLKKSGSDILLRSELSSASTVFTPSGTGSAARVTKPAAISEDETHWEVYGSADDAVYYLLSEIAVGTTTYDDSTAPASYTGDGPPLVGTNLLPPSAKYLIADEARVLMAGSHAVAADKTNAAETDPKFNRVWWTALLGTNNIGDDERVPNISGIQASYIDVDEDITGMGGPLFGSVYVFSLNKVWKLTSTGNAEAPYVRIAVANQGCIDHRSIVIADDEVGSPALYWISRNGPWRFGVNGLQSLSTDLQNTVWSDLSSSPSALHHGVYFKDKHQLHWWISTGTDPTPDTHVIFDTHLGKTDDNNRVRYGWSKGPYGTALCSAMFANTKGTNMSADLKPHVGRAATTVAKLDDTNQLDGVSFASYLETSDLYPWGLGRTGAIPDELYLYAKVSNDTSLTTTVYRDFKEETVSTQSKTLTLDGNEERVRVKVDGVQGADLETLRIRVGDGSGQDAAFNIDAIVIPASVGGRDGVGEP